MKQITGFLLGAACAVAGCMPLSATNYYIDSSRGSDGNGGTAPSSAWKSFANLGDVTLVAGDSVLLRGGTSYAAPFEITGQGRKRRPVVVGRWGEGDDPRIVGDGSAQYAVRVFNSDWLVVQDLDITNRGSARKGRRTGVKIECRDHGLSQGVTVRRLTVHDVNGELTRDKGEGSGILVESVADKVPTAFDRLLIEDCVISRCERNGINFRANTDRRHWFPNRGVVIRGNLIDEVPGDGIVPIGCDGAVVEYNLMRNSPRTLTGREAAAGFWPGNCDNSILRYNEVSDCKAPWDAQGFDADFNCLNTTIEYNYSHDNEGGFLLVCNPGPGVYDMTGKLGNEGTVVRYNISVNDGLRPVPSRQGVYSPIIHVGGTSNNTEISHNILHANANPVKGMDNCMIASDSWGGFSDDTRYLSNVFYAAVPYTFRFSKSTRDLFRGNYYIGEFSGRPDDSEGRYDSAWYRGLLAGDPSGFRAVEPLLLTRRIANGRAEVRYVNPKAIKRFFRDMSRNN